MVELIPGSVSNHKQLQAFINQLRGDLATHPDTWESVTLEDYLEGIEAWLHDLAGLHRNLGKEWPPQATWEFMAAMLLAGKIYEGSLNCSIIVRHGLPPATGLSPAEGSLHP